MGSGGKREGAGRKALMDRPTKDRVRAASEEIDGLQGASVKVLEKALDATTRVSWVAGRDDAGKPLYETLEVPDHSLRIRAAQILLNKRIPDLSRQELTGKDGEKVDLGVIIYPGPKKAPGAQ